MTERGKIAGSATLTERIISDFSEIERLWATVPALHGAPQSFDWIDCWHRCVNSDCFVAGIFDADRPVFLLPLEVIRQNGMRIARYPGGNHANGNFPWLNRAQASSVSRKALERLVAIIRKERPDIDALSLTRQLEAVDDIDNPLFALGQKRNPNPVLMVALDGGFDAVLDRTNRRRRLKKHRQHERRYEEAGGWRIEKPRTRAESDQVLDLYFAMKAGRFRQMGITDPFADKAVQTFFKALYGQALAAPAPLCELRFLEVGGIIRSIVGKNLTDSGPTAEFAAIADDDMAHASPGEFLFFEDIKRCCDAGYAAYSFGVGDEPYKRDWCDIELEIFDTVLPLSAKGRLFVALQSTRSAIASTIKRNPRLWRLAKRIRAKLARR
ncbi:GNAT family N-acetyltransferase [Ochrobactrum sp. RH2CCR150]|uniref:GNAT family N-acetyltransferase n=1 Tax=Ochrobactrum sp. RH2CCR150 TaxID=2587044 RepID=UPI0015FB025E|nr:CelD/BcsL family acetyltransferase involved in cellulose biosynthesis [Ochrobactrum sp. RH2CCR150]